jgi:hypothetical protein
MVLQWVCMLMTQCTGVNALSLITVPHMLPLLSPAAPCCHRWVEYLEDWMGVHYNASRDLYQGDKPGRVHVKNSAVPGTFSSYMSVCYNMHVPPVRSGSNASGVCLYTA